MPSLVFAGDKINAETERRAACLRFSSLHRRLFVCVRSQIHVCMHAPYAAEMLLRLSVCMCTSMCPCASSSTELFNSAHVLWWAWVFKHVCLCVHLALDEVIILVDLQDISGVAGDGAAVSVVVVARATALQLCIAG